MSTISAINAFTVPYREPNDHDSTRHVSLVQIIDSDGVEGWGEAVTLFKEATVATTALTRALADFILGEDATPEHFAKIFSERSWWYGVSGIACFSASAIDTALWDIAGKRAGIPLVNLLGKVQTSLPIAISCHATISDIREMATLMASQVTANNAIGIKVGFGKRGKANLGFDHSRDVNFVSTLREALGNNSLIMIDIGAKIAWTISEAISRIRSFEEYGVYWTEEPLGADNIAGYGQLKESTNSLIAYGEREWNPIGYRKIITSGTVDIVGIDPGRAMGITGFVETLKCIEKHQIQANAHAFAGPITYAASLAISQSSNACKQIEKMPYRNGLYEFISDTTEIVNGLASCGELPGLGVMVDVSEVKRVSLN